MKTFREFYQESHGIVNYPTDNGANEQVHVVMKRVAQSVADYMDYVVAGHTKNPTDV